MTAMAVSMERLTARAATEIDMREMDPLRLALASSASTPVHRLVSREPARPETCSTAGTRKATAKTVARQAA